MGCTNRWVRGCGVIFYRFPADLERRARWVAAVNRKNWQLTDHSWLCSCHFISGAKSDDPLSPDSVPSVFPHTASPQKRKRVNAMKSYEQRKRVCAARRETALREEEIATALLQLNVEASASWCDGTSSVNDLCSESTTCALLQCDQPLQLQINHVATQTDSSIQNDVGTETDVSSLSLKRECHILRKEIHKLSRTLESFQMSIDSFEADPKRLKFYTGLDSIHAFKAIFNLIAPAIEDHHLSSLPKFSVFIKLRLNPSDQDLGYRFGVSQLPFQKFGSNSYIYVSNHA